METARTRTPRQRATLVNTRSRETRLALIRAAVRLWSEGDFDESYESSTAADIAAGANVSKGTFYFHFANKEAILLEMSSSTVQSMIDEVAAGTGQDIPLRQLSDQVMSVMARRVVRVPKTAALRAAGLGFTGRIDVGTPAHPRLDVAFESLLRYGVDRGELGPDLDIAEGAAMLTALAMQAIILWGRGGRSTAWLDQALHDRVAVVLRGISRPDDV